MKLPTLNQRISRQYVLELIIRARKEKDFKVSALEEMAKVPKDTIRDFERGKSYLIRSDKLQKILNVLGYDLIISRLAVAFAALAFSMISNDNLHY
jgi:transcriptional regulator with XRE-family HTH domain